MITDTMDLVHMNVPMQPEVTIKYPKWFMTGVLIGLTVAFVAIGLFVR